MRSKSALFLLAALGSSASSSCVSAAILTFDDLVAGSIIEEYRGVTFSQRPERPSSGQQGLVLNLADGDLGFSSTYLDTPPNALYIGGAVTFGDPTDQLLITLPGPAHSVSFRIFDNVFVEGQPGNIPSSFGVGFYGMPATGQEIGSYLGSHAVGVYGSREMTFEYAGIYQVLFENRASLNGAGLAIDDFSYVESHAAVPVPAVVWLIASALGVLGLIGGAKKAA